MIFIFFGPPGAGKGTQASLISKKYNIPHLSTGNILRNKLIEKDDLSEKLMDIMESGNLVSDDILNKLIVSRLNKGDCNHGFILDGYPRTMPQATFLDKYLSSRDLNISKVINLKVDLINIKKRIKSRSLIEDREDDKDEVIKIRLDKYELETKPLSDFYDEKLGSNYHVINGNQEIEKIQSDINQII